MKITKLNLWVLAKLFDGCEERDNAFDTGHLRVIRRCFQAGLVEPMPRVKGTTPRIRLTEAGKKALKRNG